MFYPSVLTVKGKELQAKILAGVAVPQFTCLKLGDGYLDGVDLEDVSTLLNVKQSFPFSSVEVIKDKTVQLRAVINNDGIKEGYLIKEAGICAMDPDHGEILYSIARGVEEKYDYQPSEDEVSGANTTFDYLTQTSNANEVRIQIDCGAVASAEDLKDLEKIVLQKRINVVVIEADIPIEEREEKTFYFKVTDKQSINTVNHIKVSPNMGLKIL